MTREGQIAKLVAAAGVPLLFGAVFAVARVNEPRAAALRPGPDVLNISSARVIKKLSLGYESLMADIYWTRVVQYYGDKRHAQEEGDTSEAMHHYPLLDSLLDITVTRDPRLDVAYKAGAIFLAEPVPRGAGRPDKAVLLLRQGVANNPEQWRLWADLG